MELDDKLKNFIISNKNSIEKFQWALINSISVLIYSEYIHCMKNKYVHTHKVHIPAIKSIYNILSPESTFMNMIKGRFVDGLLNNELLSKYLSISDLNIINDENVLYMKLVIGEYMIPNIFKRIPETISMKFGINDPTQNIMIEDSHIDIFKSIKLDSEDTLNFIIDEFVLCLLIFLDSIDKDIEFPESNSEIYVTGDEIIKIGNDHAICPVLINQSIMKYHKIYDLLLFVTSTTIREANTFPVWKLSKISDAISPMKLLLFVFTI